LEAGAAAALVREAAHLIGVFGLTGGQFAEIGAPADAAEGKQKLDYVAKHKTAPLFVLAATVGAYLAAATPETVIRLLEYSRNLGYAFQVSDDILDQEENHPLSFPRLYGEEGARHLLGEKIARAVQQIKGLDSADGLLEHLARTVEQRVLMRELA
jgi:geranylgeranyl diphosphate synthase type II